MTHLAVDDMCDAPLTVLELRSHDSNTRRTNKQQVRRLL